MKYFYRTLLLISFSLATTLSFTQESQPEPERGTVLPGYIINHGGDTVRGYMLNLNLWLNQKMTFFYKDPNDREGRIKYTPKDIKAYQVGPRFYESMDYTFTNSIRSDNFIMRKVDGPIKYYVWYYDEDKSKLMNWDNISLIDLEKALMFDESELWKDEFGRKRNEETLTPFGLKFLMKFAKNMSEYVKDDVELAQKIANKQEGYKNINIEAIIREYNEWYLKNHPSQ